MKWSPVIFWLLGIVLTAATALLLAELAVRGFLLRMSWGEPVAGEPGVFEYRYEVKRWSNFFSETVDPASPLLYAFRGIEIRGDLFSIRETNGTQRYFSFAEPENTLRIACLGDSLTEPWQDPEYRNYTHFLSDILQERFPDRRIEVIPIGVGGYNTWQEMHLFKEKFPGLEADLLLLQMCSNDPDVTQLVERSDDESPDSDEWPGYDVVSRGHYSRDFEAFAGSRLLWFLSRLRFYDRAGTRLHHTRLREVNGEQREALRWLARHAAARNIEFLPVIFPIYANGYSQPGVKYHRRLLTELGLDYCDLSPGLKDDDLDALAMPKDAYHPSVAGHRRAAEVLAEDCLESVRDP